MEPIYDYQDNFQMNSSLHWTEESINDLSINSTNIININSGPVSSKAQQHRRSILEISIDLHDILQEMQEDDKGGSIASISIDSDSDSGISIGSVGVAIGIGISIGLNEATVFHNKKNNNSSINNHNNGSSSSSTTNSIPQQQQQQQQHHHDHYYQHQTSEDISMDLHDILQEMQDDECKDDDDTTITTTTSFIGTGRQTPQQQHAGNNNNNNLSLWKGFDFDSVHWGSFLDMLHTNTRNASSNMLSRCDSITTMSKQQEHQQPGRKVVRFKKCETVYNY